ncbi:unnamed protein product, partial [Rotaria magnacalcarata]
MADSISSDLRPFGLACKTR